MSERATGDLPGTTLDGRYEVQRLIGRGGMASVYRARDTELQRSVAIKVLRNDDGEQIDVGRRIREARALASINHPALVTLHDAVIREDRSYLVMELVDGHTLRDEIDAGPLEAADVAAIAADLAAALHAVHSAGIIHRDIKPANILLEPATLSDHRFRTKLSDFGIAHFVDSTRMTTPGQLLGTAPYVAPEQARGYAPAAPSDIYALGLTLLEALTGKPAFVGSALEVVAARLSRDPDVPASLGTQWVELLSHMTTREPASRPTALEVAMAAKRLAVESADTAASASRTVGAPRPEEGTDGMTASYDLQSVGDTTRLSTLHTDDSAATAERTVTDDAPPAGDGGSPDRSRRPLVIGVLAAALILIAAAVITPAVIVLSPAPATTPTATLPSLPTPLDTDMRDLLEQVSP